MNNNLDTNDTEKKKKKKILYCSNCGRIGHCFKFCIEPISSYGIILVNAYYLISYNYRI